MDWLTDKSCQKSECKKAAWFYSFIHQPPLFYNHQTDFWLTQVAMEDSIDVILQNHGGVLSSHTPHPVVSACPVHRRVRSVECLCSAWPWYHPFETQGNLDVRFLIPNLLKSVWNVTIKTFTPAQFVCTVAEVPYLPSSKAQTLNIMKLLEGRAGRLVDLGSGDGRVVSVPLVPIPRN